MTSIDPPENHSRFRIWLRERPWRRIGRHIMVPLIVGTAVAIMWQTLRFTDPSSGEFYFNLLIYCAVSLAIYILILIPFSMINDRFTALWRDFIIYFFSTFATIVFLIEALDSSDSFPFKYDAYLLPSVLLGGLIVIYRIIIGRYSNINDETP